MAKLLYSLTESLDGYIADEKGNFDWSEPDEVEHRFVNDLIRPVGTFLFGRRMYETMRFWETALDDPSHPDYMRDFAEIYLAADKIVYSKSLTDVTTARTTLKSSLDLDEIRALKSSADRDIEIAGPTLAARAIEAGLVDEYHFFIAPVILGGGTKMLPDNVKLKLRLLDEKRFETGKLYLHYEPV